ncbi:2-polyprenyl-3-methyl-6-methoxy-1,4-benzoquinone monooxygenase [Rhabdochromatium marinum]|uniref:2-polyprenyl-3-methyl-6-methoxy-1,4-benzoquinone monooxygenase n=1 Tax=Rhabdochromatium marinum TaxID=48729 RepID=UPI0019044B3F|nr:2-polyprenyl-3-methyl-6-methoxy-1,4-benzoquinone monooxygenase [Rhabdochromatium marinum]MBK1649412.1 demethoxyubiquinone hydroxylase family protein [Rhabdochromatium marinum]
MPDAITAGTPDCPLDRAILHFDSALRTLFGQPHATDRANPAQNFPDIELSTEERQRAGRLMRVNHTGEVCAQALYQGQALTARDTEVRAQLERSAREENDHLLWCHERLQELGSRKSLLNPLWYGSSLTLGAIAGLSGDQWSLGFVVETEQQVEDHLAEHIDRLPLADQRSRAILEQMKRDEIHHAEVARGAGAAELPTPIKWAMQAVSKVMTKGAYWV